VRRAIRYAKLLDIEQAFVAEVSQAIGEFFASAYPDVQDQISKIGEILAEEEQKFQRALAKGLHELEKVDTIDALTAFQLYETYGFPFELTQEIAQEKGVSLSEAEFMQEKRKHAEASRTASAGMFKGGLQDHSEQTTKYHTATHLLHAALRKVLGTHVQQKGSNITAERLRFDFSHPQAMTKEELQKVEDQINAWIEQDLPVTKQMMKKEDALKSGAIAFFIEKYPDEVSVYTIGKDVDNNWISKEFCGGPHVEHTGQIGKIKIQKEQAVSAGVRRVYLV
jgi:alanyl-tRNA synthetase